MYHLSIPEKSKDKRASVAVHQELMKEQSHDLNNVKVQLCVYSRCNLASQVMTSDYTNSDNLKIHIKKYLNEFHSVEKIMKIVKIVIKKYYAGHHNAIIWIWIK